MPSQKTSLQLSKRALLLCGAAVSMARFAGQGSADSTSSISNDQPSRLPDILDTITTEILRESPELATSLAVPSESVGGKYADRLDDRSAAGLVRRAHICERGIEALNRTDPRVLTPAERISREVVATGLSLSLAGSRFGFGQSGFFEPRPYVVEQINSAHVTVPAFLDAQHKLRNKDDVEDYLSRLSALATALDQETERVRADEA